MMNSEHAESSASRPVRRDLLCRRWDGRRLHFIAIGGAGMSALALVCRGLGATVTGSDRAESSYLRTLRAAGLEPRIGHDPEMVPADAEVVVSTAIGEDNPELVRARERGQRVMHRGELLAEVCAQRRLIAVSGTHGKTTTAGMLAHGLRAAGVDVPFLLGGELPGIGPGGAAANAGWGESEWIVAEADESDGSFLELRPEVAVVTNIELDHHSRWRTRAELVDAFNRFVEPASGVALGPGVNLKGSDPLRFDEGSPGPDPLELGRPGPPQPAERAGRDRRGRARRARPSRLRRRANRLSRHEAAARAQGGGLRGRRLRRLRPPSDRGRGGARGASRARAAAAHRRLPAAPLLAHEGPRRRVRRRARGRRRGRGARGLPAREEPVGELAGVSGLQVAEAAADRAGGRPVWWLRDAESAIAALAPRLGDGDVVVALGAGDIGERFAEPLLHSEP